MIYLIKSAAFTEDDGYETILKIGYAQDNSMRHREESYRTENPTFKIIHTIPEGDKQDERNLHHKFKHLLRHGREWFEESDEIYEFFDSHTTKESLAELEVNYSTRKQQIVDKIRESEVERIRWMISKVCENCSRIDYIIQSEELFMKLGSMSREEASAYLASVYPEIDFKVPEIPKDLMNLVEELNTILTFPDKIKYIRSIESDLTSEQMKVFIDFIPSRLKDYYLVFGTEKMKALNYRESDIKSLWDKLYGNTTLSDDVRDGIYSKFVVGNKYLCSEVKEMLKDIYTRVGYQNTAKATDLLNYFEVKDIKIEINGKRSRGFEIVSKK